MYLQLNARVFVVNDVQFAERFREFDPEMNVVVVESVQHTDEFAEVTILEIVQVLLKAGLAVFHSPSSVTFVQDPIPFMRIEQQCCSVMFLGDQEGPLSTFMFFRPSAERFVLFILSLWIDYTSNMHFFRSAPMDNIEPDAFAFRRTLKMMHLPIETLTDKHVPLPTSFCVLKETLFVPWKNIPEFTGNGLRELVYALPAAYTLPIVLHYTVDRFDNALAYSRCSGMSMETFQNPTQHMCHPFRPLLRSIAHFQL